MLSEVFIEERQVVETQSECNLLNRHIGRFKLCFRIHDNDIAQDIQRGSSADFLYYVAEMLQGDIKPLGIIGDAMLFRIVLHRQLHELAAYLHIACHRSIAIWRMVFIQFDYSLHEDGEDSLYDLLSLIHI